MLEKIIGNYIEVDKYLFNIAKSIINENKEINYKEQKTSIANKKREITSKSSYSRTHSGNNKK